MGLYFYVSIPSDGEAAGRHIVTGACNGRPQIMADILGLLVAGGEELFVRRHQNFI